jgi:D-glycero-beta-D-manno-heptose 1-phosphate adenylyltransferase
MQDIKKKIISLDDFLPIRAKIKNEKKKLVFTNGCFDLIHRGHIEYLTAARKLGDYLVIGLNSDKSVRKIKGPNRPIVSQEDRAFVLSALEAVDFVLIFDEPTPEEIIKKILPDVLVKGADWNEENIVGADVVKKNGGEVVRINFVEGCSSTNIIEAVLKAYGK